MQSRDKMPLYFKTITAVKLHISTLCQIWFQNKHFVLHQWACGISMHVKLEASDQLNTLSNSDDPDAMLHLSPFDQDKHCMLKHSSVKEL